MSSVVPLKQGLAQMGIALFLTYLSVALALPVVSVFVIEEWKLPNWLGGLAVGIAFVSTILSRGHAGYLADTGSSKRCTLVGVVLYMWAAVLCALAALIGLPVPWAFALLLLGRLVLGLGESMAMVGVINWHFSLLGPRHSGRILAVAGMAIYGSFAVGGPLGLGLYERYGFVAVMVASFLLPAVGWLLLGRTPAVAAPTQSAARGSFAGVLRKIWKQGMVVGLQGVGFAVLGAFVALYFTSRGWPHAGLGLTLFGAGFVISRLLFGGLPDKVGGVFVALASLAVESTGLGLLWLAPDYRLALLGALMTGLGCSMVFPSMGVEAIRRVSPEQRATAFGGFAAFQDVAYAFSAPVAGLLADAYGYSAVFLLGCLAAATGASMVLAMASKPE